MFEGDLEEGELEIGQVSGRIDDIRPAADILARILSEYREALVRTRRMPSFGA